MEDYISMGQIQSGVNSLVMSALGAKFGKETTKSLGNISAINNAAIPSTEYSSIAQKVATNINYDATKAYTANELSKKQATTKSNNAKDFKARLENAKKRKIRQQSVGGRE